MKGVVVLGDHRVEVRELPVPEPGYGQVLVRAVQAGICGSDIHPFRAAPGPRPPQAGQGLFVQGHELVGVVDRVGPGVEHVQTGDRVFCYLGWGCGHCEECADGHGNLCLDRRDQGRMDRYQKEYSLVREEMALRMPQELSFDDALMLTCAGGTAWAGLRKAAPSCDDSVVVFGLGPVGLMALFWAKAMGAYVIGVEMSDERLALAQQLGAHAVVDAKREDPVMRVRELTRGKGATVAVETSGNKGAQAQLFEVTQRKARLVYVAGAPAGAVMDPNPFGNWGRLGLRQVVGTVTYGIADWYQMAETLVLHGYKPGQLITHRFPIEQAQEAYDVTESGRCGKVVFEWPVR